MEIAPRQIVAFGGGGFSMESGNPLLDDYVLGLCRRERPRVCFLPSASGDAEDLRRHLLSQDLIYVGGGSVISLLGVWRAHGLDAILRESWEAGVVLCGLSAGSLCWFDEAVTGFHGVPRRVRGLGLLPFSNCVHYEPTSERRFAYHEMLRDGMRPGYAAEDGAGLHFVGCELNRVVASRPAARAYRLDEIGQRVVEIGLATAYLGDARPASRLPGADSPSLATASAA
jgi:dipeptidase E